MSDTMNAYLAGKMDNGSGNGCCMPVMPMYGMPYGMPYGMGGYGGYGFGGFGEWFPMILIAGLLFGGGGFGFGFGGGNALQGMATRADINEGFALQNITGGIQGIQQGICDATYSLNNAVTTGFHGVDNAICNQGYQTQAAINGISREIGDCCCKTQTAIQGVNFNLAKGLCDLGNVINLQTRDLVDNQNANYRGIMDFLVQEKLAGKDARIAQLENEVALNGLYARVDAKVDSVAAELLRRTGHDCPVAAYVVQPSTPVTFPANACGQVQFNTGCGNGYGCCAA